MRRLVSVILFILCCHFSFGQNSDLKKLLIAANDSIQINLFEGAYKKCEEALEMSRAEGNKEFILESLDLMSSINKKKGKVGEELKVELEILDFHKKYNDKKELYYCYIRLGNLYQEQKIFHKSADSYLSAIRTAPDKKGGTIAKEKISDVLLLDKEYAQSRRYRRKLIEQYEKTEQWNLVLYHRQKIADSWMDEERFLKAVEENEIILDIAKKLNDNKNEAIALNNIGTAYTRAKDYKMALDFFKQSEDICNGKALVDLSILFSNIGIAYHNIGKVGHSIDYLLKAKKHSKEEIIKAELGHKVAEIYLSNNDLYNAQVHNNEVLKLKTSIGENEIMSQSYRTAAQIEKGLYNYEGAFEYYEKHLDLEQKFSLKKNKENQRLLELQSKMEQSEKEIKLELASREIEAGKIKSEKERLAFEKDKLDLEKENIKLEKEKHEKEIALLSEEQKVKASALARQTAELKTKELESQALREREQQELALANQRLEAEKKSRELDESQRQQEMQRLELKAAQDSTRLKQQELIASQEAERTKAELLEKEQSVSQLNRIIAFVVGSLSLLIIGLILFFLRVSNRKNRQLAQKNDEIEEQKVALEKSHDLIVEEREKSENLLLNILPAPIATELKEKGTATAKVYDLVTILFTDFGGFTKISYDMSADELIDDLNICFVAFDNIVEKYGMEKIKTIGDSYMCAGGVPIPDSVSPSDVIKAALEMNAFMKKRLTEYESQDKEYWGTRIGIHSGVVVAGVVGKNKFAYDIWGNAVNVASRMESGAEMNTINISAVTYELIKDDFNCTYRGEFPIKNAGMMKMYRVDGVKEP